MPEPIFERGPVATPYTYTVAGTGTVTPLACQAVYDGSGAGGDYVPAVIYRSQDGNVIARATLDGTIVAGDDAEVSWFPGVKNAPAATVTKGSWLHVVAGTGTPSGTIPLQNGTELGIADFNTDDSARFAQTSATEWTMTRGVYLIVGQLRNTTGVATVANGDFSVGVNSSSGFVCYAVGGNGARIINISYGGMTIGDQSSVTPWRILACGADTHAWVGEADFYYVPGT